MMNNKMLCTVSGSLRDVYQTIDLNGKGIAFLVDDEKVLYGVMTDGDLRRLLLNGYGLNEKISPHIHPQYTFAYDNENINDINEKTNERIKIVPIVNNEKKIVNYYEFNNSVHIPIAQPQLGGNEYHYLMDAFLSTWISSSGKYITEFEDKFSLYCGTKYGVATSNGTVALHLALVALDIGVGDEVIVPDITFAATINAVLYTGATPVIVDIENNSWCMDPAEVEKAITVKTKAIIPVHIYGQPCDMEKIGIIAKKYNLRIIEDCAEAHGAEFRGKRVGSFGDISCFSFFGNKVITTGEGGMCITDSPELNEKMRILRDHGMCKSRKYYHEVLGFNYRITNLQASIGVAQLERIEEILTWRKSLEESYRKAFEGFPQIKFQENNLKDRKKITWLITVLTDEQSRKKCMETLQANEIDARPFFIPLSEMKLYEKYTFSNTNSSAISKRGFNLPTSYEITENMVTKIVAIIKNALI